MNDSGLLGMGDDAWMDGDRDDDSDGTPRVSGFGFGVTARGLGLFSERRVAPSRVPRWVTALAGSRTRNDSDEGWIAIKSIGTPPGRMDFDFDLSGERLTVAVFRMYARRALAVAT